MNFPCFKKNKTKSPSILAMLVYIGHKSLECPIFEETKLHVARSTFHAVELLRRRTSYAALRGSLAAAEASCAGASKISKKIKPCS